MKFTGLCLGVLAAIFACTLAKEVGFDDVEILFYSGGVNKGRVWPTDSGNIGQNLTGYDKCSQAVFLIPGFTMGRNNPAFVYDAITISKNSNYNVFLVNYNNSYLLTAPTIAAPQIVDFQNKLMAKYTFDKSHITLVSFSLGTVVSGAVGRLLGGVGKILAFDPCGLQFDYLPNSLRLDSSDAQTLICMHTTDLIGTKRNKMCHANLFWDGGNYPHGCPDTNMFCGHVLALTVLAEAVTNCQLDYTLCDSYSAYRNGDCTGNPSLTLGIDMTIPSNYPTTGAKYFYDTPVNINVTNYNIGLFRGSICSKTRTVNYNGKFC